MQFAGFKATLGTLDSIVGHVPTDGPLVIVTASFEGKATRPPPFVPSTRILIYPPGHTGEPADNAAHFFEWLQNLKGSELAGVKYSVFGCGNRDWVRTFQRVPTVIDDLLAERGAKRMQERGVGDAQAAEFFQAFDEWEAQLWKALSEVSPSQGLWCGPRPRL